jgi:hypothetical protein
MGIPAGNWKLEPARFSETAEQIYCAARCKNAEDCHWSNTRRENMKICIVIRDTETLYFLSLKSTALIFRLCGGGSSSEQIVACMGETRNTTGFLWGNLKERNSFEELCLDGRIALKYILIV